MNRAALCLISALSITAKASEWVTVEGGHSPDQKFLIAAIPQDAGKAVEVDGTVLLMDAKSGKRIGPLEEVDSSGGMWGITTDNVRCQWSADSKLLIVNFRTGRLMRCSQIYRISGRRAIPLTLPPASSHPKGKILDVLTTNSNPGAQITLSEDGKIVERCWGYMPKDGHFDEDYSKYGLAGFEGIQGSLRFIYEPAKGGGFKLVDIVPD